MKKIVRTMMVLLMVMVSSSALAKEYRYEIVPGDPMKTRIYTLEHQMFEIVGETGILSGVVATSRLHGYHRLHTRLLFVDGKITGEVSAKETTQNEIMKYATSFENKISTQGQNSKEEQS